MIHHILLHAIRRTYANLDTGKFLGAQMGNDILDSVMAAGTSGWTNAQLAHRQGDIVIDHQHMVCRDLVELCGLPHSLAGEVHIGLRLHNKALATRKV